MLVEINKNNNNMTFLSYLSQTITNFCIPIIIGIFTFALPLLLQTISRIDDKYHSTLLSGLFVKEPICKSFLISLLLSFVCILLWILKIPRIIDWGSLNIWLENSASLALILSSIILIISTCIVIYLTYIYYFPQKLIERLYEKYNKKPHNRIYFDGISKVLNYSIVTADEALARQTYDIIVDVCMISRENKEGQVVEYPEELYDNIYEANELLLKRERRTLSYLNDSSLFSLFIDEVQRTEISDKTYRFLWLSIRQALHYDNDEAIKKYWEKAHQYSNFALERIQPEYDSKYNIINKDDLEKQARTKYRFIEIHYALGGLLMYHRKYDIIKFITSYTNQFPPKYILLPTSTSDIIIKYMEIAKKCDFTNFLYFANNYPFDGVSSINENEIICFWIKKYFAVLFLRQYTIPSYYVYESPMQMPNIPKDLSLQRFWNNEMDILKDIIEETLNNEELLRVLELNCMLDSQWFNEKNLINPIVRINSYKKEIDIKMEKTKKEQSISMKRLIEFKESTKRILSSQFKSYKKIFKNENINEDYMTIRITGLHQLYEKQAYVDNPEITYVDADTFVAKQSLMNFSYSISNVFLLMQYKKYLFTEQNVFSVINSICNRQDFLIFSIKNNLDYLKIKAPLLCLKDGKWYYNNIPIIEIEGQIQDSLSHSFWIINQNDLPYIKFNEHHSDLIKKYRLEKIDDEYNIYASIVDLNQNPDIKDEFSKNVMKDLDKKALVCVDFNAELLCKKSSKAIQLKIYSQFMDREQANISNDVDYNWLT